MSHIHHTKLISNMEREIVTIGTVIQVELANELQKQYIHHPLKRMTSDEFLSMSDDDLLHLDYFLREFNELDDNNWSDDGFYIL